MSVWLLACATAHGQEAADDANAATPEAPAEANAEPGGANPPDAAEPPAETVAAEAPAASSSADGLRADFVSFLHFASIGQFDYAQAHAKSLLQRPDVAPLSAETAETLVALARERPKAIDTLILLINNSTIGEEAGKVMALIREAHRRKRMDPDQIARSIAMLAGGPTDQATGLERLIESGEYAVPAMLAVVADSRQKGLQPYVIQALPRLGKPAVNPLAAALRVRNEVVQQVVAETLGRLAYPQALPYLKRLAGDKDANSTVRRAGEEAIRSIVVSDPRIKDAPASQLFEELAEGYYAEVDSLRPDPKEPRANVWVVEGETIKAVDVPRQIFCMVMSMQACEAGLGLNKSQPEVLALWLAANFRRESRLGLDVQTTEAAVVDDPTRPAKFERGISYAGKSGPECCQLVLARGLRDKDRPVVLGAIAGLAATAGPNTMQLDGSKSPGLVEAVRFPDQLVRIRAALVFGTVLPKRPFVGATDVVPVLASALSITDQRKYLVIDPDKQLVETIAADLTKPGAKVITAERLELGLAHAAKQVSQLDGVFLASDITSPGPADALHVLARDEHFGLVPVVVYVKEGGMIVADQVIEADVRVGRVLVVPDKSPVELLVSKLEQVGVNYGYKPLSAEEGTALALEATRALQRIAANESRVFDPSVAEPALVAALNHHASEEVRIAATRVLALLNTATAQPAIAAVALAA
ncbi:MAG: HEAT repeat domain-containing protein, partial [Planctomycetes bacterium]|nr:HEAT repeat domain-containing protein [Planctomycetota bacterium]